MTILSKGAPFFICHSDTLTIPTRENRKICTGTRENRKNQKDKLFRKNIKSRFMDYLYSIEQYTAKKTRHFNSKKRHSLSLRHSKAISSTDCSGRKRMLFGSLSDVFSNLSESCGKVLRKNQVTLHKRPRHFSAANGTFRRSNLHCHPLHKPSKRHPF